MAQEKLNSLFDLHSQIIRRHKAGNVTEFGRKVWLDEGDGGLVTHWTIPTGRSRLDDPDGNPPDESQWRPRP